MTRREVSVRFLVNQLKEQRKVLDFLDWITSDTTSKSDRHRLWAIRTELVQIFERDISSKKGVILFSSEEEEGTSPLSKEGQKQMFEQARIEQPRVVVSRRRWGRRQ